MNLDTTDRELRRVFERYGKIEDAMIINDRKTGMSRGFGFVYYQNSEDAIVAKEETNGLEIDGMGLTIVISRIKVHSQTSIYRAPIYRAPPFTGPHFFLLNTGFMSKSLQL